MVECAGMPQNAEAKAHLSARFQEHVERIGCFNKHCTSGVDLQVSHVHANKPCRKRAEKNAKTKTAKTKTTKTFVPTPSPRKMIFWYAQSARKAKSEDILLELSKCGILCRRCHNAFDGAVKWGWEKVPWYDEYKEKGPNSAKWPKWQRDYLKESKLRD